MTPRVEKQPTDEDVSEQSRTAELRRMLEEYARHLRQIVEKFRRRLH